ncbi:prepilin-type N-terminal cleavage/methylation domain-containing protein [Omnitrophica bacterium]|nr:prepilin-type N-terminal cleavage/methylation domain-containing protein [Candidatus Omnitrophota bacterium]
MLRSLSVSNSKRGFLLLEVLVSITVISVGLVFVVRSFSSSARAIETATHFLKSVSLMEEKLWDLEAKGAIEKGRDDGLFEMDREYLWKVEAEGLEDIPINVVNLKVEWGTPKGRQKVSLETYMWHDEGE